MLTIQARVTPNLRVRFERKYRQELAIFATTASDIALAKTKEELRRRNHLAEGSLEDSLKTEIRSLKDKGLFVRIFSNDPAARALEFGTKPARYELVNVGAIYKWVLAKGIKPNNSSSTQLSVAFAIAHSIARQGFTLQGKVVATNRKRPFNAAQKKSQALIAKAFAKFAANLTNI